MKILRLACVLSMIFMSAVASNAESTKLTPPAIGKIEVAVVISDGAVMIDFAGPWEVFSDVMLDATGRNHQQRHPFHLYTVAESAKAIRTSGGMQVVPDYTFENAPKSNIVIVPAQSNESPRMMAWIRKMSNQSDVLMSVCTGAFLLAKAGVLDGKNATTHHEAYASLEHGYPKIAVQKGMRYVQSDPVVFTAGGLSSGIDLALHVVELYYGDTVADATARHLEYEGTGWKGDGTASVDFTAPVKAGLSGTLDNLSNNTFGNPSTEFSRKGAIVEFSFSGDPAYKGTLSEDGNTIDGTLYISDGSTVALKWTRTKLLSDTATAPGASLPIVGDWDARLEHGNLSANFKLHIRD